MKQRPLGLAEFIGPLSLCANTMDDQYKDFKTFTDQYTGDKNRRDALELLLRGDDAGDGPKKNKKGKGGKKKKK